MMPTTECNYMIRVRGRLDPRWSDRLGGLEIEHLEVDGEMTSLLSGLLADQSALSGVLNSLVDLQFAVLSVDRLGHKVGPNV
jgi:hypothetical protein